MLFDPKKAVKTGDGLILLHAADLLENSQLLKFERGFNPSTGFCLIGAINYALSGETYGYTEEKAVKLTIEVGKTVNIEPGGDKMYSSPAQNAVQWNNAPERTKEEVVDAIRQTAYRIG